MSGKRSVRKVINWRYSISSINGAAQQASFLQLHSVSKKTSERFFTGVQKNKLDVLTSREINAKEILRDTKIYASEYSWQYYL